MSKNENTEQDYEAGIMFGKAFGLVMNADEEARNMFFMVSEILHKTKKEVPSLAVKFSRHDSKTNQTDCWSIDFDVSIRKLTKEEYEAQ